jgi:hypothetical protein
MSACAPSPSTNALPWIHTMTGALSGIRSGVWTLM